MIGDVLGGFEHALVVQVRGAAGRTEGVVADPGLDAGRSGTPLNHSVGVLLPHGVAGENGGLAGRCPEQRRARVSGDISGRDVSRCK